MRSYYEKFYYDNTNNATTNETSSTDVRIGGMNGVGVRIDAGRMVRSSNACDLLDPHHDRRRDDPFEKPQHHQQRVRRWHRPYDPYSSSYCASSAPSAGGVLAAADVDTAVDTTANTTSLTASSSSSSSSAATSSKTKDRNQVRSGAVEGDPTDNRNKDSTPRSISSSSSGSSSSSSSSSMTTFSSSGVVDVAKNPDNDVARRTGSGTQTRQQQLDSAGGNGGHRAGTYSGTDAVAAAVAVAVPPRVSYERYEPPPGGRVMNSSASCNNRFSGVSNCINLLSSRPTAPEREQRTVARYVAQTTSAAADVASTSTTTMPTTTKSTFRVVGIAPSSTASRSKPTSNFSSLPPLFGGNNNRNRTAAQAAKKIGEDGKAKRAASYFAAGSLAKSAAVGCGDDAPPLLDWTTMKKCDRGGDNALTGWIRSNSSNRAAGRPAGATLVQRLAPILEEDAAQEKQKKRQQPHQFSQVMLTEADVAFLFEPDVDEQFLNDFLSLSQRYGGLGSCTMQIRFVIPKYSLGDVESGRVDAVSAVDVAAAAESATLSATATVPDAVGVGSSGCNGKNNNNNNNNKHVRHYYEELTRTVQVPYGFLNYAQNFSMMDDYLTVFSTDRIVDKVWNGIVQERNDQYWPFQCSACRKYPATYRNAEVMKCIADSTYDVGQLEYRVTLLPCFTVCEQADCWTLASIVRDRMWTTAAPKRVPTTTLTAAAAAAPPPPPLPPSTPLASTLKMANEAAKYARKSPPKKNHGENTTKTTVRTSSAPSVTTISPSLTTTLGATAATRESAGLCAHCGNTKPHANSMTAAMMIACPRCNSSRYCSVQCRKDGWKDHKHTCQRAFCDNCGVQEQSIHDEKALFSSCSRCLRTYYCSKRCQLEHWKHHKFSCKQLAR